jgi:hydroxyacylglutathione hydrolase
MTADQPPRPANMENIVAINQGQRPCSMGEPVPAPLSARDAAARAAAGHVLLDVRSRDEFRAGHPRGAYQVEAASSPFEQYAAWILPADRPLVLVVDAPEAARTAARKLAFVGLDARVAGFVRADDWRREGLPLATLDSTDVARVHRERLRVLDVREAGEWREGRVEGALQASFKQLGGALGALGIDRGEPLAVMCAGGRRSVIACSILMANGFERVVNVEGGMGEWHRAGLPVASGPTGAP